jgi:integrase
MPKPKFPKPWYRKKRGWYVTLDGEQIPLGKGRETAFEQYHDLMRQPRERKVLAASVVSIIDQFLDWVQKNRAADTYIWYQSRLQLFGRKYPDLLTKELKPIHVQQWIDSYDHLSSGSKRNHARSVVRCMNWAEEQGLVERSPLAHFKKPKGGARQTVITPEEYAAILGLIPSEPFRDLVIFAWETGARAAECLAIEKRHVDLSSHRIIFPVEEEKMERMPRIIYLTDIAEEIVRRLVLRYPAGPIFRNTDGLAWTTEAANCAFVALQIRFGLRVMKAEGFSLTDEEIQRKIATLKPDRKVKGRGVRKTADELRDEAKRKLRNAAACARSKKLCLTVFRHSFCHRLLKSGVDALTVSVLMGHADPTMIAKVYSHLSHAPQYLRDSLRKAAG